MYVYVHTFQPYCSVSPIPCWCAARQLFAAMIFLIFFLSLFFYLIILSCTSIQGYFCIYIHICCPPEHMTTSITSNNKKQNTIRLAVYARWTATKITTEGNMILRSYGRIITIAFDNYDYLLIDLFSITIYMYACRV